VVVPFEALPLADGRYRREGTASLRRSAARPAGAPGPDATVKPGPALVLAGTTTTTSSRRAGTLADYGEIPSSPGGAVSPRAGQGGQPGSVREVAVFARLPGTAAARPRRSSRPGPAHPAGAAGLKTDKDDQEKLVKATGGPRILVLSNDGYFLPDQEARCPSCLPTTRQAAMRKKGPSRGEKNPLFARRLALAGPTAAAARGRKFRGPTASPEAWGGRLRPERHRVGGAECLRDGAGAVITARAWPGFAVAPVHFFSDFFFWARAPGAHQGGWWPACGKSRTGRRPSEAAFLRRWRKAKARPPGGGAAAGK